MPSFQDLQLALFKRDRPAGKVLALIGITISNKTSHFLGSKLFEPIINKCLPFSTAQFYDVDLIPQYNDYWTYLKRKIK